MSQKKVDAYKDKKNARSKARRKERADGTFMEFCLLSLLDSEIDASQ